MADAVDSPDPCVRLEALRAVYRRIISGTQESETQYRGIDTERRVRYTQANIALLLEEIRNAEAECQASQGEPVTRGRRFAIEAGFRRPRF